MPGNDEETVKGSDHPGSLRSGLRVGSCLYDTDAGRGRVTPVRSVSARLPLGLQKYDHAAEILLQPSMRGFLRRDVDPEGMQSRGADYADNFIVVCGAQAGTATAEGFLERIVWHRCSHVEEGLYRRPVSAHLLSCPVIVLSIDLLDAGMRGEGRAVSDG